MTATANPANEYVAMPMEALDGSEWKPVDWPNIAPGYQISLYGEVISPKGNKVKQQMRNDYVIVAMRLKGSNNSTSVRVDQLMLSTFDHYDPHLMPEHIDGDDTNCQLINLRWREPTSLEVRHKKATATARKARGKGETGKKLKPKPRSKAVPSSPRPRITPGVEMLRVYRAAGMSIPVTPTGEIPAKSLPQGRLTVTKVAALADILKAIVEMNSFMGVAENL